MVLTATVYFYFHTDAVVGLSWNIYHLIEDGPQGNKYTVRKNGGSSTKMSDLGFLSVLQFPLHFFFTEGFQHIFFSLVYCNQYTFFLLHVFGLYAVMFFLRCFCLYIPIFQNSVYNQIHCLKIKRNCTILNVFSAISFKLAFASSECGQTIVRERSSRKLYV